MKCTLALMPENVFRAGYFILHLSVSERRLFSEVSSTRLQRITCLVLHARYSCALRHTESKKGEEVMVSCIPHRFL